MPRAALGAGGVSIQNITNIPGIGPGDSVLVDSGLRVAVAAAAADGAPIRFTLEITGGCLPRTFYPVLQVGATVLTFDRSWLDGPPLLPGASRGLLEADADRAADRAAGGLSADVRFGATAGDQLVRAELSTTRTKLPRNLPARSVYGGMHRRMRDLGRAYLSEHG